MNDKVYYAIGDIHGEADMLKKIHKKIHKYHDKKFPEYKKVIVHLGDYINRGPDSYGVIEFIIDQERKGECEIISLMGNHEELMIEAWVAGKKSTKRIWMNNGGSETMKSYEKRGYKKPRKKHMNWLQKLPSKFYDEERKLCFVHAGIDPKIFPDEPSYVYRWTRAVAFFKPSKWKNKNLKNVRVVHGHTPSKSGKPDVSKCRRRINVDTAACYGGPLTAAVMVPGKKLRFMRVK